MMRVALSGGIASGKTVVSNSLAAYGVPIVDTDILAREVVQPGTVGLEQIVGRFGDDILDDSGHLDRKKLRDIVFSDDDARRDLEAIVHPLVRDLAKKKLDQYEANGALYSVVVIPLLVETGQHKDYDHVIIVDVEPEDQLERLMQRDNSSLEQAESIVATQATRMERLSIADDLILNSTTLKAVDLQVKKVHQRITQIAKRRKKES